MATEMPTDMITKATTFFLFIRKRKISERFGVGSLMRPCTDDVLTVSRATNPRVRRNQIGKVDHSMHALVNAERFGPTELTYFINTDISSACPVDLDTYHL
jgi:hypothetical protein